jgi:DNA modification methylase
MYIPSLARPKFSLDALHLHQLTLFFNREISHRYILLFVEQCLPTFSTFPVVVTKTSKVIQAENLFSARNEIVVKEKDSGIVYQRQKPVKLYEQLLDIFKADKLLHVIDACSGVGSCGVACQQKGLKCVILEKSRLKFRLINQRVKQ